MHLFNIILYEVVSCLKLKISLTTGTWTKPLKNQPYDVIKMRDYPSLFKWFSVPLNPISLIFKTSLFLFLSVFLPLQITELIGSPFKKPPHRTKDGFRLFYFYL